MNGYRGPLVSDAFDRTGQHEPRDRETLKVAAVELRQLGLYTADIAAALKISEPAVRELLEEAP